MADAATCTKAGQKVPQGCDPFELMVKAVARKGDVPLCGTCMDARDCSSARATEPVLVFRPAAMMRRSALFGPLTAPKGNTTKRLPFALIPGLLAVSLHAKPNDGHALQGVTAGKVACDITIDEPRKLLLFLKVIEAP